MAVREAKDGDGGALAGWAMICTARQIASFIDSETNTAEQVEDRTRGLVIDFNLTERQHEGGPRNKTDHQYIF